jgi:hypothetical protein
MKAVGKMFGNSSDDKMMAIYDFEVKLAKVIQSLFLYLQNYSATPKSMAVFNLLAYFWHENLVSKLKHSSV